MAGGKGKIHLHPKANTNGFDKRPENINREGRPLGIKETYKRTVEERNGIIWQPINWMGTKEDFEKFRSMSGIQMKRRGDKYFIGFQLRKKEAFIAEIDRLIFSNTKDAIKVKMLTWLIEMFDGKAQQHLDITSNGASVSNYIIAPASLMKQILEDQKKKEDGQP